MHTGLLHLKNFLTSYSEYLLTLPLPVNAREPLCELQTGLSDDKLLGHDTDFRVDFSESCVTRPYHQWMFLDYESPA